MHGNGGGWGQTLRLQSERGGEFSRTATLIERSNCFREMMHAERGH